MSLPILPGFRAGSKEPRQFDLARQLRSRLGLPPISISIRHLQATARLTDALSRRVVQARSRVSGYRALWCSQFLLNHLVVVRAWHIKVVLLVLAIALPPGSIGAARAQDFPPGFDKLIDKQKTGEKQEKTPDGKPKMGLKDPVCNNAECRALWDQTRDALEIWHAYKASPASSQDDIKSIKKTLGVDHAGYGEIQTKKAKLKKSDPDKFGDQAKLEKHLKELTGKYEKCQKPCPQEQAKPKREEDCIIVLQYKETDAGVAAAIATNTAVNEDFMGGAQALAAKLKLDPSKIKVVGPEDDLISAIAGYATDGVCCKSLAIFGHGTPVSGALLLPNKMTDGPVGAANNTLGGNVEMTHTAAARQEFAKKKLQELKEAIRKNCADPKLTVSFYSCFVGETNGLAKQLAELGIKTEGFSGSCTFPKDKDTGEYLLPSGKDGAEIKEFPAIGGGGGEFKKPDKVRRREPGYPFGEQISHVLTATDGETWCEYGDGVAIETEIVETDQYGTPVEIVEETTTTAGQIATRLESSSTESSGTAEGEQQVDQAKSREDGPEVPGVPADTRSEGQTPEPEKEPEPPKTPPEVSELPEAPPPKAPETEDVPEEPTSPIPDTIFVKAKEEVLEGETAGSPIENQVVKLFPAEEPALPGTGESKEAEDTGFDKDPVECMTGAGGDCAMQIPADDRQAYDLPGADGEPGRNYRVEYDLPQDSGGVAETTGKSAAPDVKSGTPEGAGVTTEEFSIGDRSFIRLVYTLVYGVQHDFDEQFKPVFGEDYEEDYCRDKQPGPPLGKEPLSYSALDRDLPEATISFGAAGSGHGQAP